MHGRTLAIAASLLAGCFQPADTRVPIRCDADNPCPAQQTCIAGLCSFAQLQDLSASSDMTGPDMAISSVGCASGGGTKIGTQMWACPGAFSMGQARSLCATGWSVCTRLASADMPACDSQSGVFIADVPAYQVNINPITCSTTTIYTRFFGACASTNIVQYPNECGGFFRFATDRNAGFDFSNGHSIDKAIGNTASNGVVCCR